MASVSIVSITRKETFSACHRLHSVHLSDTVNQEIFGKCNNPNGHGHNYSVEVTVKGPIDIITGMVMNLTELKSVMDNSIMKKLDHKNIDKDVPYFNTLPSTAENLAVYIWDCMKTTLKKPELLYEVKLYETDKNFVTYRGKMRNGGGRMYERRLSENICGHIESDSD